MPTRLTVKSTFTGSVTFRNVSWPSSVPVLSPVFVTLSLSKCATGNCAASRKLPPVTAPFQPLSPRSAEARSMSATTFEAAQSSGSKRNHPRAIARRPTGFE